MHRITGSEITVDPTDMGVFMKQDNDIILVELPDCENMVDVFNQIMEEPEPTPEKWYVVLKNSNCRLTNAPNKPIVFTTHLEARTYARRFGGLERTYVPISVDEYERAFGR